MKALRLNYKSVATRPHGKSGSHPSGQDSVEGVIFFQLGYGPSQTLRLTSAQVG